MTGADVIKVFSMLDSDYKKAKSISDLMNDTNLDFYTVEDVIFYLERKDLILIDAYDNIYLW